MYFSENQEIISGLSTAYNKSYLSYLDLASLNYSKKWNLFLSIFVVPKPVSGIQQHSIWEVKLMNKLINECAKDMLYLNTFTLPNKCTIFILNILFWFDNLVLNF